MNEVKLTHTQFQTEVVLYTHQIMGVIFAPTQKSTIVIGTGGAAVPVLGTVEEVNQLIKEAMKASEKEKN